MPTSTTPEGTRLRFVSLVAVTIVTGIVSSLGAPLVPAVAAEQEVPLSTAQWILTAALLSGAMVTPVVGRLGTGPLRRPVLIGGLGVVLAGILMCALPLGIGPMIVGRALQGVGMALVPLAFAYARDLWAGPELVSRLSLLSVATVSGAGFGYPVSSVVAAHLGIRGAYAFGAVLVATTVVLALRHLPAARDGRPQPVDVVGAVLLSTGTLGFLLATSQGERWGWSGFPTVAVGGGGAILLTLWVVWSLARTRRGGAALVDLRLALRAGLRAPNVVTIAISVSLYGLFTLVVVVIQADGSAGFGLDAGLAMSGLALVPYAVGSVVSNRIALLVARKGGAHLLLPVGCLVFGSSLLLLAQWHDAVWKVFLAMALGGLSGGLTFSSMAMLIVPHVSAEETSSVMAFNQLLRYVGFAAGSALTVTLLDAWGADGDAFRATGLAMAGICVAASVFAIADRAMTNRVTGDSQAL